MKIEYTPVDYKPEKVGKKYRIELTTYAIGLSMGTTIWGDTPELAMEKAANFLKSATPKIEPQTNEQHP